jgi:RNA polymerase primary sigma factor
MQGIRFRAKFGAAEEADRFRTYRLQDASVANRLLAGEHVSTSEQSELKRLEDELVAAYFPLVTAVAEKVFVANRAHLNDDLDELVSAGYEGLLKAFRAFDPERGFRFATYASWWIFQAVTQAMRGERWIMGISDYRYREVLSVSRALHELQQKLIRKPTAKEIADYLAMPLQKVSRIFAWANRQTISVDTPVGKGSSTIGDFIVDHKANPLIVALENSNVLQWIAHCLEGLTPRERSVVQQRFGLLGAEASSVKEIAAKAQLSPRGVRYVESRALRKLKSRMLADSTKGSRHREVGQATFAAA